MKNTDSLKHLALAALAVFIPFSYGGNGEFAELLLCGVILLLWGRELFISCKTRTFFFRRCGAEKLFVATFILISLSTILSSYVYASIYSFIVFSFLLGTFYLVFQECFLSASAPLLLGGIAISAIIQSFLVICQSIFMSVPRPSGTFVNPNFCGLLIVMGLLIMLSYMLFPPKTIKNKKLYYLAFAFMVTALFLTRSRASFMALVFALLFTASLLKKKAILLAALALLICVFLFPNPVRNRFFEGVSAYVRIPIWKASLRIIKDNPLWGVGLGNFKDYARPYNFPSESTTASKYFKVLDSAHSGPLQQGGELGLPGVFIYFAFWWFLYKTGRERNSELCEKNPDAWGLLASISGLFSVFVASFVNNSLHTVGVSFSAVILAGILVCGKQETKQLEYQVISDCTPREISCIRVFISLILSFTWFFCSLSPYMGNYYFSKGVKAVNSRDKEKLLKAAVAWNPLHAYYYDRLGKVYGERFLKGGKTSDFTQAKSFFEKAISKNQCESIFEHNIGILFYHRYAKTKNKNNLIETLVHFHKEQALTPKSPFIKRDIANIYFKFGAFDKAEKELAEAVEIEPNFIEGWYLLSSAQKRQRKYKESSKSLSKTLALAGFISIDVEERLLKEHNYIRKLLRIPEAFIENTGC